MKKIAYAVLLLMFAALLFGCAPQRQEEADPPPPQEAAWEIVIEGVEGAPVTFTSIDAEELEIVEIEVVVERDGVEETQRWKGIPLKAVLEAVGATDYTGVIVEGADGYTQEYSLEIATRPELGLELNGEPLDEELGPVQAVPKGEPRRMFVRNLAKITVLN